MLTLGPIFRGKYRIKANVLINTILDVAFKI